MDIGVVFPQTEIGEDPLAIRDYAQAAEALGYNHLLAYDHVLGANPASRPGWSPPYTYKHMFHEPFVLFGYLAGITKRIGLVTGILILPQRQTALVAKQAAAVDVLSSGRLRLGIGIGWNPVEYEALEENFKNRGRRSEEQIEVLRALWTQELVTFDGRWHKITDAGLNPLPIQRPIPIWLGGSAEPVLRRVARMGDGWLAPTQPVDKIRPLAEKIHSYARAIGREPSGIGMEIRFPIGARSPEEWIQETIEWKKLGATHLSVDTMKAAFKTPSAHIDAIRRFKEAVAGSL